MKRAKRPRTATQKQASSPPLPSHAPQQSVPQRFPAGGGWAVSTVRGPRLRAAYPANLAKRDAAVADLKSAAERNKLLVWGLYENQRSKLHYVHDDPVMPKRASVVFLGTAAKLARGQLACGCNRRAAAAARSLDLSVPSALAEDAARRPALH